MWTGMQSGSGARENEWVVVSNRAGSEIAIIPTLWLLVVCSSCRREHAKSREPRLQPAPSFQQP